MAGKYLKNSEGIVRAVTSDNLQLEKPLLNENYDIEVHNRNMDKIDNAIQEVKGKVDGLELTAERVSIADPTNKFEATNVEDALLENKTSIQSANDKIANNTKLANQALSKANEAFLRGDNVKTQLVDKLISEGLDVSTNNSFEELIENIALGKKWASGTVTSSTAKLTFSYYDGSSNTTWVYAQLPELNFNVSKIIYVMHDVNWIGVLDNVDKKNIIFAQYTDNSTTRGLICNFKLDNVVFSNNIYKLPVSNPSNQINVNWIAFE